MIKFPHEKMMFNSVGIIHFSGIGGIGMSGIAEILHNLGYQIQGSDQSESDNVKRLMSKGIKVFIGQKGENLIDATILVKSTAIKDNNPEIIYAKANNIPIVKRSEMLAELMRLKISIAVTGAHGKTTTTSLVASCFEEAGLNPTVINGGIIEGIGTNAYLGSGDYLVAEADESDETFIKIPSTIGVITNLDPEHLDHYHTFDNLKKAYRTFVENLPFYGFLLACYDHEETAKLIDSIEDKQIYTYGIDSENLDVKAINIVNDVSSSKFDVIFSSKITGSVEKIIKDIHLPIAGIHNVLNSLSALGIACKLNFSDEYIKNAFKHFQGVKRRFTKTNEVNGVIYIDDYAHHPAEIIATLKTARNIVSKTGNKIIAIAQPHRYSRLHSLFSDYIHCFDDADLLYISEIYSAGESPITGVSRDILVNAIKQSYPEKNVHPLDSENQLPEIIKKIACPGDIVIFMGAGNITSWSYLVPEKVLELDKLGK